MHVDRANNPEELLDVVNDQDQVIGQATRQEIHKKRLLHRGVAVLLHDANKRILVQQRSRKKKHNPGGWSLSIGGHVPAHMEPAEAAKKELMEELGFEVPLRFIRKSNGESGGSWRFRYLYIGEYGGQHIRINRDEVQQVRLVNQHDVEQMVSNGESFGKNSLLTMKEFWEEKLG